jgi:hypothetical protein
MAAGKTQPAAQTTAEEPGPTPVDKIEQPTIAPSPTPIQIMGSIVDDRTNTPLPTATIYLNTDTLPAEAITVSADGRFQLQSLELPLNVRVEAPGYEIWENTLDTQSPVEIRLSPSKTVGVVLAADTNTPLENIMLIARNQTATTNAAGQFEFYSLLPGDVITVQPPAGYLPLEAEFNGQEELLLVLAPRQLAITVKNSFTGEPISNGLVTANQTLSATTNAEGQVSFAPTPAQGQITVSSPGYMTTTIDYQNQEAVDIALAPVSIQGVIRGGDTGELLPKAAIYLGDKVFRADDTGQFVLDTLPITPTQLMVKMAGYHRTYAQLSPTGVLTGFEPAPFSGGEGRWLAAAPCTQPAGAPCFDIILEPFHAKAIYVPLHYLRSRERMLDYLDFIAATELNAIVVDVKGDFGFIAWESDVDLVEEIGADDWFNDTWLPLDEFIAEAKARNIYTIARMVVFKDNPLATGKPEWAAVREDGAVWLDREELGWANPFREEVWEYNIELAKEVAAFGFDELNFDYIRFPSDGDVGAIVYEEENTLETRTTAIREFVTRLSEALRPTGVFVSADVFGLTLWVVPDSDMRIGQRVIDVAPQVDYLAPMVYPSTFITGNLGYDNPSAEPYGVVFRSQEQAETLVPPYVKVRPWLQGYWYSLDEMRQLKQAAIDSHSTGWSWWNAGGKYDSELFEAAEESK